MKTKTIIIALMVMFLGGCDYSANEATSYSPEPDTATVQIAFNDDPASFYEQPHGMILFIRGQDQANLRLCNAGMVQLTLTARPTIGANEVPTFWKDKRNRSMVDTSDESPDLTCAELIKHYDYAAALRWFTELNSRCSCLRSTGPALVAFSNATTTIFAVDLSHVTDPYRMNAIMAIWRQEIVRNPALWSKSAFRVELLRAEYQHFTDVLTYIYPV